MRKFGAALLTAALLVGVGAGPGRATEEPYADLRVEQFNAAIAADTNAFTAITPRRAASSAVRVSVAVVTTDTVFYVRHVNGGTSINDTMNEGVALTAGRPYHFHAVFTADTALTVRCATATTFAYLIVEEVPTAVLFSRRSAPPTSDGSTPVAGPSSATDNAIARFDGTTGKVVQNSAVTVADTTGTITLPAAGALNWSDLGLARNAAGVARITDASTGIRALLATTVYEIHAADDTLGATESGSTFSNSGAATRTLTLPTVAQSGVSFVFVSNVNAQVLRVDPGAAEKFVGITGGWADGEYLELDRFEAVGVVSQADGDWLVTFTRGTPAEESP